MVTPFLSKVSDNGLAMVSTIEESDEETEIDIDVASVREHCDKYSAVIMAWAHVEQLCVWVAKADTVLQDIGILRSQLGVGEMRGKEIRDEIVRWCGEVKKLNYRKKKDNHDEATMSELGQAMLDIDIEEGHGSEAQANNLRRLVVKTRGL